MTVDPHLLRVLHAVGRTGSITGAAAELGYSQPALSQLLGRAERRLGQTLVLRAGGRAAVLTEAGRILAAHALHVDAALAAAQEDLDAVDGLARGRVRLAGFPSASSTLVPAVLARMAAETPGIATSYVEAEPPEALDLLRAGHVDVALTFTHDGDAVVPDPALQVHGLGQDPLVLVRYRAAGDGDGDGDGDGAGAGAGAGDGDSAAGAGAGAGDGAAGAGAGAGLVDLAGLREERWIGGCPRCRGHLLASCAAAGFSPDIVLETDNAAAVVGMVAAGLGVALLPRLALATTVVPATVEVRAVDPDLARRVEVVVARGAERVPSTAVAIAAARAAAGVLG
ncbi:LysR family transcriptional regulator [Curtobacterium sp. MCBA15_012]|uniref:LysR family transcriptional regulator n=1 Tax=unclassified Curtobacterium TaxID=257496 RepID=UPI0008DD1492|nr:LysR substrate-binding domain-containing protein [Curtobacterium sp. MCBA15_012]WIB01423.1 LysR substrate-binding domain-containing protein [Curtobacterium sp. MCBA15_012]